MLPANHIDHMADSPYYSHPGPGASAMVHPGSQPSSTGGLIGDVNVHHQPQPGAFGYQIPPYGYPPGRHHSAEYALPMYRSVNMAERRAYHNATERARRENLNLRFQDLAQALPSLSTIRKPSKSVIVNHSLQFVQEIKRKVAIKDQALGSLRNYSASLLSEVNRLQAMLGMEQTLPPELDEDLQDEAAQEAARAADALKMQILQAEKEAAEAAEAAEGAAAAGGGLLSAEEGSPRPTGSSSLSPKLESASISSDTDGAHLTSSAVAPAAEGSLSRQSPETSADRSTSSTPFNADHLLTDGPFHNAYERNGASPKVLHMQGGSHDALNGVIMASNGYTDVSFVARETPTPPNSTPVIQQAPPVNGPSEYPCPTQQHSPYAHHMQLQQQQQQQQQQHHHQNQYQHHQHHNSTGGGVGVHSQHLQHGQPGHPSQHPHHHQQLSDASSGYSSLPRRAYSFDASYLPGMQQAMNQMAGGDPRFHPQH
ncbi:hypothetical protein HKX48_005028 [Thoreauomyces humboldtii]|nr:hypothetical protein HKX48_005028 [Thoreauomyces humboldtii]